MYVLDDEKANVMFTSHYESVVKNKRLYRKIGAPLPQEVNLLNGQSVIIQQAVCSIPGSDGEQLFTSVERMGNTKTVVFTYHRRYNEEARKTVT